MIQTPTEKAKELVDRFYNIDDDDPICLEAFMSYWIAKQCALISVNEISKIQTLKLYKLDAVLEGYDESDSVEYQNEVKQEIEKL
jgi:hypothetical protein